jgi:hypothetical protein
VPLGVVAPQEMKEGTTLGARAQSAIQRPAVLYKSRLATFNFNFNHENLQIKLQNSMGKKVSILLFNNMYQFY